jgi:hypothetical protein
MDLAGIRFNRPSLKSEALRFSEKSIRPPSCESLVKIQRHLVQLLAIRILIANCTHSFVSGLLFYYKQLLAMALEHTWERFPMS